ncbi:MAG: DNA primase [Candidatus Xenobiia bacterium LiM19]
MTAKYSKLQIEEVLKAARIEEIVGDYINLRHSGKRFAGICPFHGDKDPSFSVNPEKGLWFCFGCHEGGNLFQFLMKIEQIEFNEALEMAARRFGVTLMAPKEREVSTHRERLLAIMKTAVQFYHEQLLTAAAGNTARAYLKSRSLTSDIAKTFMLGYAPRGRLNMLFFLESKGYSRDEIVKSGLVMTRTDTGEPVDYMRNRIIIPIQDMQGRFIALGGRIFNNDEPNAPKYLNSPETELFSKGRILFGLYQAKKAISREDRAIVVEGYMDMIALYQGGIHNVVASMGTSLSGEQARMLKKFCSECVLAYDADGAGRLATTRGVEIFEEADITPRILMLPQGEDPDSFIRRSSAKSFQELVSSACELIEYRISTLKENLDVTTPHGKSEFVKDLVPLLQRVKEPVKRNEYFKKVSEITGVKEEMLRDMHFSGTGGDGKRELFHSKGVPLKKIVSPQHYAEELLRLILANPDSISKVRESLPLSDILDKSLRRVYEILFMMDKKDAITISDFAPFIDEEGIMKMITELIMEGETPPYSEESLRDLIRKIRDEKLRVRLRELEKEVERLLSQNNIDHSDERFIEYQRLSQYFKGRK